jgi:hypothetical protein
MMDILALTELARQSLAKGIEKADHTAGVSYGTHSFYRMNLVFLLWPRIAPRGRAEKT